MPTYPGLYGHDLINQIKMPDGVTTYDVNDAQAMHFLGFTTSAITTTPYNYDYVTVGVDNLKVSVGDVVTAGTSKNMYRCTAVTPATTDPVSTGSSTWESISPDAVVPPIQTISIDNDATKVTINTETHNANITAINANLIHAVTVPTPENPEHPTPEEEAAIALAEAQNTIADGILATTQAVGTQDKTLATTEFVAEAIEGILSPMIFKGAITLTTTDSDTTKVTIAAEGASSASDIKKGYTYRVATILPNTESEEYTGNLKVGDTFIAVKDAPKLTADWTSVDWTVIESGDELDGIQQISVTAGLTATDSNTHATTITTAGTISLNLNSTTAITGDHVYAVGIGASGSALADKLVVATTKDTIENTVTDATIDNTVVTAVAASSSYANTDVDLFDVTNGVLSFKSFVVTTADNAVFQETP